MPDERRQSTTAASAMFRFTAAARSRAAAPTAADLEPEVDDDRGYGGMLDCLAACLVGKKLQLRHQPTAAAAADNVNASPISGRSARSPSPTSSSVSSLPVGAASREFQTGGVNCLLAGIELSGGFRMSLTDGAVIRMSKDRHDVDRHQMSPGPTRQAPGRQPSSAAHRAAAPVSDRDDWTTMPRYQRHLAMARLRRSADQLRSKINQFCDVLSAAGKCADDSTIRDRLVR